MQDVLAKDSRTLHIYYIHHCIYCFHHKPEDKNLEDCVTKCVSKPGAAAPSSGHTVPEHSQAVCLYGALTLVFVGAV